MSIYQIIISAYPELLELSETDRENVYLLQNDSDGAGDYIVHWNYSKPLPEGLSVGKPE